MKLDLSKVFIPVSYLTYIGKTGKREPITAPLPQVIAAYHREGDFPPNLIVEKYDNELSSDEPGTNMAWTF